MATGQRDDDEEKSVSIDERHNDEKPTMWTRIKMLPTKLGLDAPTLMTMFKGALAPTIALAAYQSNAFSSEYTTLGCVDPVVLTN